MNGDETFACSRMHARMKRATCARSHRMANGRIERAGRSAIALFMANVSCCGCPIGAAHVAGKTAEPTVGALVPATALTRAWKLRVCIGCGAPLPSYALGKARGWKKSYCSNACANDNARGKYQGEWIE
jgi:hypothetical protein